MSHQRDICCAARTHRGPAAAKIRGISGPGVTLSAFWELAEVATVWQSPLQRNACNFPTAVRSRRRTRHPTATNTIHRPTTQVQSLMPTSRYIVIALLFLSTPLLAAFLPAPPQPCEFYVLWTSPPDNDPEFACNGGCDGAVCTLFLETTATHDEYSCACPGGDHLDRDCAGYAQQSYATGLWTMQCSKQDCTTACYATIDTLTLSPLCDCH